MCGYMGNDQVIQDVAVNDTHNGSDPAPTPTNETLLTDVAPTGDSTDAATDGSWEYSGTGRHYHIHGHLHCNANRCGDSLMSYLFNIM